MDTDNILQQVEREMEREQAIKEMFNGRDVFGNPEMIRHDLSVVEQDVDYDPEDEYYNETQNAGAYPAWSDFDDPSAVNEDEDFILD